MTITLTGTSPYLAKDQRKADNATCFIGRGSSRSSTAAYARDFGALANCGKYTKDDIVFVSVEGARTGRLDLDRNEMCKAIKARAWFISDNAFNRGRAYNVGERELATLLTDMGYSAKAAIGFDVWQPLPKEVTP